MRKSAVIDLRWLAQVGSHLRVTVHLLVALGFLAALCTGAQADDADLGREVYDDFCATCHGRDMVNPGGVTFDLRKFPKDDFERFRNAVVNGKPPAMPPWRDKVSDDDVKLLWAYVRSGGG